MRQLIAATSACILFAVWVPTAQAQIDYSLTDISGSTWQYTYTITNDFAVGAVGEFTIFAPVGAYSNLSVVASPGSWSSIAVQPDPNLPAAGYFDALATTSPLAAGKSQGGFTESFTWLGKGTPGSQAFDIVNTNTFSTIASGMTVSRSAPEIDPKSGMVALTVVLGSLAISRGRRAV